MYLLFNLSSRDKIILSLFDQTILFTKEVIAKNRDLVDSIDQLLKSKKIKSEEIKGIMVVVGEGGFTSTRIAVTVANVFVYTLQIPVLGITAQQAVEPQKLINKLNKQKKGQYLSATYSAEANITKKIED